MAVLAFPAAAIADTYVCTSSNSIRVFADDAGFGSTPIRTIAGPTSGIAECYGVALDNLHGELWVTTQSTVRAFPARADGDAAPLRTISGFGFATAIAVDVEADEIYVGAVGGDGVSVYPRTSNGSPTPLRSIRGDKTMLGTVVGVFVDRVNDELYAQNYEGSIVVFSRLADGNVDPLRTLVSSLPHPFGLVVDARAGEVIVATGGATVVTYDRNGSALRTIASSSYLAQSTGLSLRQDASLLVGSQYHSSMVQDAVLTFPRTQNGDLAPISDVNFAAPPQTVIWGITSSHAFECGEGQTTSYCIFRSGLE